MNSGGVWGGGGSKSLSKLNTYPALSGSADVLLMGGEGGAQEMDATPAALELCRRLHRLQCLLL